MSDTVKRCPNCNAECPLEADFCRRCNASFPRNEEFVSVDSNETINGMSVTDLSLKINKNSARYLKIFRKNQDKKVFIHFNWKAMLFGAYWFFYRNMKGYGLLWLLMSMIVAVTSMTTTVVIFSEDIQQVQAEIEAVRNEGYPDADEIDWNGNNRAKEAYQNTLIVLEQSTVTDLVPPVPAELAAEQKRLLTQAEWCIILPQLLYTVLVGLFADCLYRRYLLNPHTHGNTYKGLVFAAMPLVGVCNILSALIAILIVAPIVG